MAKQRRGENNDSLIVFRNSQGVEVHGTLTRLTPNQVVFETYNPYSIVQMSEVLYEVKIWRNNQLIYNGKAVVNNMVGTGVMVVASATLVDALQLGELKPGPQLRAEIDQFVADWVDRHNNLSKGYHRIVVNIRNFLEELNRWTDQAETAAHIIESEHTSGLAKQFLTDIAERIWPQFQDLFGEFERQAGCVDQKYLEYHKAYARQQIHPWVMAAPFIHRTYTKPLGYAGDYEMVNMILREPWEGKTTYAKLVNGILLKSDTAQAHRNRIDLLTNYLLSIVERSAQQDQRVQVLNVGCGPAAEVVRFAQESTLSDMVDLELMDFNEQTLNYASQQVESAVNQHAREMKTRFVHLAIHDLLKAAGKKQDILPLKQRYHYVYCAGLFDYLLDKRCERLIKLFYEWVIPGGVLVVTNVHPKHSTKGFLEHLQEWYVYLRTEEDLLRLAGDLQPYATVHAEPTGINVFLEINKPIISQASNEA